MRVLLAAVAGDEVVEADREDAIGAGGADAVVDPADPRLPPLEALLHRPRVGEPAGLPDAGGGDVAAVADDVDEAGLGEERPSGPGLGDRVAALLDQAGLRPLGRQRPEQVEEELAAGGLGLVVEAAQERGPGGVQPLLRDVAVDAAEGEPRGLEVAVPVVLEAVGEEIGAGAAGEHVGEAAGVGVEAGLVRDLAEVAGLLRIFETTWVPERPVPPTNSSGDRLG